VWIISHFQQLLEEYGESSEQVTISNAMVDFLAENKLPVPKRLLTAEDKPII
jgi:hypothetical protein